MKINTNGQKIYNRTKEDRVLFSMDARTKEERERDAMLIEEWLKHNKIKKFNGSEEIK